MADFVIFQVHCSNQLGWMHEVLIRCDMLVLLEDQSITPVSTPLNSCAFPDTVLRLNQQQDHSHNGKMTQIILTSCFILQDQEHVSIRLPLIPNATDFWLEHQTTTAPQLALHLDYAKAVNLSEHEFVSTLLQQPFLLLDGRDEAKEEIHDDSNMNVVDNNLAVEEVQQAPNRSTPATKPTPMLDIPASNRGSPHDLGQWNQSATLNVHDGHGALTPLEQYLQQETAKNDRLIGFLVVISIAFLCIFGFVGYRLLPTQRRTSKLDEIKKAWKASQQTRRKNRPNFEKPFLLPPKGSSATKEAPPKSSPPNVLLQKGLVCVSPPRPQQHQEEPPPCNPPEASVQKTPTTGTKAASFADELKAKAHGANCQDDTPPVSWEDLM